MQDTREAMLVLQVLASVKKEGVMYQPRLARILGSVTATILLEQMNYWWTRDFKGHKPYQPFYKFRKPCDHKAYQEGDSWLEELAFGASEFDGALRRIGTKIGADGSKSDVLNVTEIEVNEDGEATNSNKLVMYWTNQQHVTYYEINLMLFYDLVKKAYADKIPDSDFPNSENPNWENRNLRSWKSESANSENRNPIDTETTQRLQTKTTVQEANASWGRANALTPPPDKVVTKPLTLFDNLEEPEPTNQNEESGIDFNQEHTIKAMERQIIANNAGTIANRYLQAYELAKNKQGPTGHAHRDCCAVACQAFQDILGDVPNSKRIIGLYGKMGSWWLLIETILSLATRPMVGDPMDYLSRVVEEQKETKAKGGYNGSQKGSSRRSVVAANERAERVAEEALARTEPTTHGEERERIIALIRADKEARRARGEPERVIG